jgi:release factor glutamine methyltransferase
MNSDQWLIRSADRLKGIGIESARLDALILLSDVLGKDRTHLLAHPELKLSAAHQKQLELLLKRRINHEPLAYIRGKVEFYGRELTVNKHVLVPRPESEDMIELLNEYGDIPIIIDVGTGSGALAISAALARPQAQVYAIDIDENCLELAKQNAQMLGADITFVHSDLLRNFSAFNNEQSTIVLANLPYVPDNYPINSAATHEPSLALFGGKDGLDLYRIMFDQLSEYDDQEIIVLTESLESQHNALDGIARNYGFVLGKTAGLIQSFTYIP